MFISYNWLRELTSTRLDAQDLRERLTMVGLAIDAVDDHGTDQILDVEVPSNRPDCLSHIGIAREVTVIENGVLSLPVVNDPSAEGKAETFTSVEIKDTDLCPRYAARLVRGVKIGPSPDWLVKRLEAIGQRPINNVADITNYVLHEMGQPLHAFDFQRLAGRRIVVRRATTGEKLRTLDGVDRELNPNMLVIADAERAVALAGIMGGQDSEISIDTNDVLIESAYFDPDSVRQTARALGMDTEASRRFERGADCDGVLRAQLRCVQLICEIAGGVATENALDVYPNPLAQRIVSLRPERVEGLTSLVVQTSEMKRILNGLGFVSTDRSSEGVFEYRVPSWRGDVAQEEDLVEEIARHAGYANIGSELPAAGSSGEYQPTEMKQRQLRRTLTGLGFDEAINFSFTQNHKEFALIPAFSGKEVQPELLNPIIEDASWMRSTLLHGLLGSTRHNLNHGIRVVRLFEVGRVFASAKSGELPEETFSFAMILTGGAISEGIAVSDRELDFFDLKGALDASVESMGLASLVYKKADVKHLRSGQAARISLQDGKEIGSAGRLSDSISTTYKFRQPVYIAEVDLSSLLSGAERAVHYKALARYPGVVRDISLLLDRGVQLEEILEAVRARQVSDCRGGRLVGVYEGVHIPAGKRSITIRIEYRSDERTLRDDEVDERHALLTSYLLEVFSAEQR
jgi:phenylalanyl-tRNA synthetase beta chain